jgi:hypothetical protein
MRYLHSSKNIFYLLAFFAFLAFLAFLFKDQIYKASSPQYGPQTKPVYHDKVVGPLGQFEVATENFLKYITDFIGADKNAIGFQVNQDFQTSQYLHAAAQDRKRALLN